MMGYVSEHNIECNWCTQSEAACKHIYDCECLHDTWDYMRLYANSLYQTC